MTYDEIAAMVESIGLPYAYYEFPDDTEQEPPFVCFLFPESDNVFADNSNYVDVRSLVIELYTSEKDFDRERTIEDVLKANNLTYQRSEAYIDGEKMFQITYEMEVIVK